MTSQPFCIKRVGCHAVTCSNSEGEMCLLFVSVIKHSSVVRQVNHIFRSRLSNKFRLFSDMNKYELVGSSIMEPTAK